jgi:DNA-binding PadR family transcriptional regulator
MLIPSEQLIIHTLDHKIRRTILELVHSHPYTYSELMDNLRIESGKLYYHLQFLTGFLTKQGEKKTYSITPLGEKAVGFLTHLSDTLSETDIPNLGRAYIKQVDEDRKHLNPNYLKAVIETIDLICKLAVYLHKNKSVPETLNDFLIQIKTKASAKKDLVIKRVESSALDLNEGTKLRYFWVGVSDTISKIRSAGKNASRLMENLQLEAVELQTLVSQRHLSKEALPDLQQVISEELLGFSLVQ